MLDQKIDIKALQTWDGLTSIMNGDFRNRITPPAHPSSADTSFPLETLKLRRELVPKNLPILSDYMVFRRPRKRLAGNMKTGNKGGCSSERTRSFSERGSLAMIRKIGKSHRPLISVFIV